MMKKETLSSRQKVTADDAESLFRAIQKGLIDSWRHLAVAAGEPITAAHFCNPNGDKIPVIEFFKIKRELPRNKAS